MSLLPGIACAVAGYALFYYAADVLVWAHSGDGAASADPVTLAACFGLPSAGSSGVFMPPFHVGIGVPGAISDPRGLLGGTAVTGFVGQVSAAAAADGGVTTTPGVAGGTGSPAAGVGPDLTTPGAVAGTPSSQRGPSTPAGIGAPAQNGQPATGVYVQNGLQQLANGQWVPLPGPSSSTANSSGANR